MGRGARKGRLVRSQSKEKGEVIQKGLEGIWGAQPRGSCECIGKENKNLALEVHRNVGDRGQGESG